MIGAAILGFLGLLVFISGGAVKELKMTLEELKMGDSENNEAN